MRVNLVQILRSHFFWLVIFFWSLRLTNLTTIPIYNDEAIYLDWGWRELHAPGHLFYSLYDAKPPLLMWLFGLAEMVIPNPLLAGRLVGVIFGFVTFLGIYLVARRLYDQFVACLAVLLYTVIPIFSFFDRQALMESAVGAVGVWIFYGLVRWQDSRSLIWAPVVGGVTGLGLFIKGSAVIFVVLAAGFLAWDLVHRRQVRQTLFFSYLAGLTAVIILLPLLSQGEFWRTLPSNTRFSLSGAEIASVPLLHWANNFWKNAQIVFWHLTPTLVVLTLVGLVHKQTKFPLLMYWLAGGIICQTLIIRSVVERYLVGYLPLSVVAAAAVFAAYRKINDRNFFPTGIFFLWPVAITAIQLVNPPGYFDLMGRFSRFAQREYIDGITSGYGINHAVAFFSEKARFGPIFVGVALNTGNPESAILITMSRNKNIRTGYFDGRLLGPESQGATCLKANLPVYFVSRTAELAWLDRFLVLDRQVVNPYNSNLIGIYRVDASCRGPSVDLSAIWY